MGYFSTILWDLWDGSIGVILHAIFGYQQFIDWRDRDFVDSLRLRDAYMRQ